VSLDLQDACHAVERVDQVLREGNETRRIFVLDVSSLSFSSAPVSDTGSVDIAAEFAVNLGPLWLPAAGILASLSQRFEDAVWGLLLNQLQIATGMNDSNNDLCARTVPSAWLSSG
jgi:hypothetical protein